jgi:hypothetical protein
MERLCRKGMPFRTLDGTAASRAANYETQKVEGQRRHGDVLIRDKLVKLVVDAPDVVSNRRWMKQYKDRWRAQLKQVELWMVSYGVDVE